MKVLIIYYSQSGNTMLIARHIEKGLRKAGADVTVVKLKDASYEMMADYENVKCPGENGVIKYIPCPYLNTQVLRRHGLENEDRDQMVQNIMIFASDVFCPKSYNTLRLRTTERTLSIHHFDGTWQDSKGKRRHRVTTVINHLFGEKKGSRIDKGLGNIEYCVQAAKGKLKRKK